MVAFGPGFADVHPVRRMEVAELKPEIDPRVALKVVKLPYFLSTQGSTSACCFSITGPNLSSALSGSLYQFGRLPSGASRITVRDLVPPDGGAQRRLASRGHAAGAPLR